MADTRTPEKKVEDIENTLAALRQIRQPYEEMVDNIITYVNHSRRKIRDTGMKGAKTGVEIYDGSAMSAVNLAMDGICGYSFSKSYQWFDYTLPGKLNFPAWSGMRAWSGKRMDEIPEVKMWLDDCEEVMYAAFLRSNFYDISPEVVRDALTIGTPHILIEEDMSQGRIVLTNPHFREVCIAEDRYGKVDTHYREFKYTLRQMVDKFGMEGMTRADPNFENKLNKNPHDEMELIHAIYPRQDYDRSLFNSMNKPVASIWVLKGGGSGKAERLLLESGYDESPILSWRWRKNNDEIYGRSPSWDAYVDIAKANQEARTNLSAAHRMVEPPMVGPEDLRGKVVNAPRGWTWIGRDLTPDRWPKPLNTGITLPFALEQQQRTDEIIRNHYSVDFFLMLSQAAQNKVPLTATQVIEMAGEKAAVLGTKIGRMESEFLNPCHDRMFSIEMRAGRIPMPPQILLDYAGSHIEIDYLGPLAQAQKRIGKSQILRAGIQVVGEMSAVFPEVKYLLDPIQAIKLLLDAQGFPMKALRTDEQIEQLIAAQHRMEEAQKLVKEGIEIAKGASRLTKEIEPGSPLDLITGREKGTA